MKSVIYSFVLLLFSWNAFSQQMHFHDQVDPLFNDSMYSAIFKKACLDLAKQKGIAEMHIQSNYPSFEYKLIDASKDLIAKKLDMQVKNGSLKKSKIETAQKVYSQTIYRAVLSTLQEETELRRQLFTPDKNDRILLFHSDIHLLTDGQIRVKEKIKVANFNGGQNNLIQRGITRDFPTSYCSSWGVLYDVPFTIHSITRNGQEEDYHTKSLSNGIRILCGRSDKILPEGIYEYTIEYTTSRQLKFHKDREEFYWNVTGNGWLFTIDEASGTIYSPRDIVPTDISVYTGKQGSKNANAKVTQNGKSPIHVVTTKRLEPEEGLTLSASYPKGTFSQHATKEWLQLIQDNTFLCIVILFFLLHAILLYLHWHKVGRDPKKGVIIPQFEPPQGLSPAAMGYIHHQKFKDIFFSAALIDLAVRRKISIDVSRSGLIFKSTTYTFKVNNHIHHDDYCHTTYGFDEIDLDQFEITSGTYNKSFASLYRSFTRHVESEVVSAGKSDAKKFLSFNDDYIGMGIVALVGIFISGIIYLSVYIPPFPHVLLLIVLFLISVLIQTFFMVIIKAYSVHGRKTADAILGFKMYLETTEQDRFDRMNPPEMTLQLFEKYLPYAIVLEVENQWASKFNAIIEKAIADGQEPIMYRHYRSMSSSSYSSFTSSLSSGLSSSVSSASTPPSSSSSSGSFGGGSSGGGGGGGGGGGW
jgi:uncharacterized membrane protein YgcG